MPRSWGRIDPNDHELIRRLHDSGVTYRQIAEAWCCSIERIGQICRGYVAVKREDGRWSVRSPFWPPADIEGQITVEEAIDAAEQDS
jgi:hypothetical protein